MTPLNLRKGDRKAKSPMGLDPNPDKFHEKISVVKWKMPNFLSINDIKSTEIQDNWGRFCHDAILMEEDRRRPDSAGLNSVWTTPDTFSPRHFFILYAGMMRQPEAFDEIQEASADSFDRFMGWNSPGTCRMENFYQRYTMSLVFTQLKTVIGWDYWDNKS